MTGEDLCAYIELRFYNSAGTRHNARLPHARGIRLVDELAADGSISYSASLLADTFDAAPSLLEGPGFGKAAIVLQAGQPPVEVFGWELVPTSGTIVAEPGQQDITPTAPGLRHILEYAPVFNETHTSWDNLTDDARVLGWMSASNAYWYSAGDWDTPLSYGPIVLSGGRTGEKITADLTPANGDLYSFRTGFVLAAATAVRIFWQCDDEGTLYVDSKIADQSSSANTTQSITIGLGAGPHTIAARVKNTLPPQNGFAALVVNLTTNTVIRRTDTGNWLAWKGSYPPGMTIGAILRTLLDEAQDEGAYGVDLLTPDFTGVLDSNGDPWPEVQEVVFPIGDTSYGDVVRHMEELGCEVHITPDFTLQAFIEQGTDVSNDVWFQPGDNIISLSYQGSGDIRTKAIVRTHSGWVEVTDTAGVTAYGKRWLGVTSGTSASAAQGARLGSRALQHTAQGRYVYTAVIGARVDAVPFLDFSKGDLVTCLNRLGEFEAMSVLSITPATPDDTTGPVLFTIELGAA